ncbi:hypothetical protein ABIC71_000120 [Herbaspirillum seropedicae]
MTKVSRPFVFWGPRARPDAVAGRDRVPQCAAKQKRSIDENQSAFCVLGPQHRLLPFGLSSCATRSVSKAQGRITIPCAPSIRACGATQSERAGYRGSTFPRPSTTTTCTHPVSKLGHPPPIRADAVQISYHL